MSTGSGNFTPPQPMSTASDVWSKSANTAAVNFSPLAAQIEYLSSLVESRISAVQAQKSAVSVADMFDLQATMNKLSQFSEAASSVISGLNSVASAISRNIKS